eukprot:TRINITY_DN8358_c0_g1_i1.p1 TRINITY_DN8358_c0_g1~~TRINITY_DN8358_c0_g1_i1.p1  ORF type:complete len:302 (-),score=85.39 TRINITY_DN8358_c0_g1_i1:560-1414(-)
MGGYVAKLAFMPPNNSPQIRHPYDMITTTSRHKIPMQFFSHPQAKSTILFSHGNAEDLPLSEEYVKYLGEELRTNIAWYDYPGYSVSVDKNGNKIIPSEGYAYEAIEETYSHILKQYNVKPETVILMGRSLGSGPTTEMAKRLSDRGTPPQGVILVSALLSCVRVAFFTQSSVTLPIDMFVNRSKIHKIKAPIFIMHGDTDEVINVYHGQTLYEIIKESEHAYEPWWIPGAGHNDIEHLHGKLFLSKLKDFITFTEERRGNKMEIDPPIIVEKEEDGTSSSFCI